MKKTLALLFAALLLVSATACAGNTTPADTTADTSLVLPQDTTEASTTEVVTDAQGNVIPGTQDTTASDEISEQNPTFAEKTLTLYVWANANVRSTTVLGSDDNIVGWVTKGQDLTATGESENWYRVTIKNSEGEDITGYVAKTIAGDKAILDTFTEVDNEEIELTGNVNVRSFPNAAGGSYNRVGGLKAGDKVTRVAVGDGWSCILFEVVSETETNAEGEAVKTMERCYIINDYIKGEEAATDAATEAATEEVKE